MAIVTRPSARPLNTTVSDSPGPRITVWPSTTNVTGRSPPVLARVTVATPLPSTHSRPTDTDGWPGRSQSTFTVCDMSLPSAVIVMSTTPSARSDNVTVSVAPGATITVWPSTTNVTGRSPPVLARVTVATPSPSTHSTLTETAGLPGRSQSTLTVCDRSLPSAVMEIVTTPSAKPVRVTVSSSPGSTTTVWPSTTKVMGRSPAVFSSVTVATPSP